MWISDLGSFDLEHVALKLLMTVNIVVAVSRVALPEMRKLIHFIRKEWRGCHCTPLKVIDRTPAGEHQQTMGINDPPQWLMALMAADRSAIPTSSK